MQRMYNVTEWSIDQQFDKTKSMSEFACDIPNIQREDKNEEFEPGMAQFSKIYKDLLANKKKFMDRRSELTPGLVLTSVLKAANDHRLRFNKRPNTENDFKIVKIKRIE